MLIYDEGIISQEQSLFVYQATNFNISQLNGGTYMKKIFTNLFTFFRKKKNDSESKGKRKQSKPTFFRNISIGGKYLFIFSISVILFTVATIVVFLQLTRANDDVMNIIEKSELSDNMAQLALLVERQDSTVSNHIIVGGRLNVEEFEEISEELKEIFEQLKNEFAGQEDNEYILSRITDNHEEIKNIFFNEITNENKNEEDITYAHINHGSLKTSTVSLINHLIENVNEKRNISTDLVRGSMDKSITFLIVVNVISILIGLIIMFVVSRVISRHLKRVVSVTTDIASGNLAVEQMDYKGKDEIGQITSAVNTLSHNMRNIIHKVSEASQSVSKSSDVLTVSANEVKEGSDQMVVTMEELASGAETQANSSSDLSSQMQQIVDSVQVSQKEGQEIANSSQAVLSLTADCSNLMKQSVTQMDKIDTIVSEAVNKVRGLDQQSDEISKL